MKVLFLGPEDSALIEYLINNGEEVVFTSEKINLEYIEKCNPDFIVSYGFRHIIKKDILDKFHGRAVNLHISYLPWNRGADPNFWSFVENTPKGVTIHYLDEGIDTGDIIVQKEVYFSENETLKTSYEKLQVEIQELFKDNWNKIKQNQCPRMKQRGEGSCHKSKDKGKYMYLLENGWDTPVRKLLNIEVDK